MSPQYSRRRFLRKSTAAVAGAMTLAATVGRPLLGRTLGILNQASRTPELGEAAFLPLLSNGPEPQGPSKLGIHTIRPNESVNFVTEVSAAGAHVALVKALDDLGYLQIIKAVSPDTIRVARRQDPWGGGIAAEGDPAVAAQGRMAWHMNAWEPDRANVDYWEVLNEADPPGVKGHRWLAEFYRACIDIANRYGYRLAIFSYSVGVPEWEEWEAIVETGVFERAKQGGHILALHEYNWPVMDQDWGARLPGRPRDLDRGVRTGRYRYLYEDFLIPRNQVIPLAVTEAGFDPSVFGQPWDDTWKERFVSEMAWYDDKLREDDYVLGCALFTLGGVGIWIDWDYEELLPDLRDHIIALGDA